LLQKAYDNIHITLRMLLHYFGKLKIQMFCRYGRKRKQIAFFIASKFVIRPQILIFSVFKIASLSPCWLQIRFSVSLFFCLFTFTVNLCPHWRKRWDNDLFLSQRDKPQTHRTVREILRETGIHRSSVSQIICKDLRLKRFRRRRAQEHNGLPIT